MWSSQDSRDVSSWSECRSIQFWLIIFMTWWWSWGQAAMWSPWTLRNNLEYRHLSKLPTMVGLQGPALELIWGDVRGRSPDFKEGFALDTRYIIPHPSQPRATNLFLTNVRALMFTSLKYANNWVEKEKSEKYWKRWKRELIKFLIVVLSFNKSI